jgi:DNA N-6-adenine-methyltransferase (Dam)
LKALAGVSGELVLRDALTPAESSRLAELEQVVDAGLQTFVDVGLALLEIRDERLYRETHGTFEAYLDERWGMSRSRGYRLIDGARVAELVSPIGDIANEAQARELVPLLAEEAELVEVWRELRAEHGARLTAAKVREAVEQRLDIERRIGTLKSTGSVEWYTPAAYVDAAREVLGGIDLDPASCELANRVVRARVFYDRDSDGLAREWRGRVFLNPPYGRQCGEFVAKALDEHRAGHVQAAILLLNGYAFDVSWFRPLWDFLLCFTHHRIDFYSPTRVLNGGTTGSVFVYLGADRARFARVFARFGAVVERSPYAFDEAGR